MQARIENPVQTIPGAMQALQKLAATTHRAGIPPATLQLIELRASQINGCAVCLDMHSRELRNLGESDQRIFTAAAWREAPYFTDAERAALALTEAITRLADRPEAVSDEIWDEAARHYDESSSARWCSRSPRSTPGTGSTPRPGRSAATGSSSGSRRISRPPDIAGPRRGGHEPAPAPS